MESMQEPSFFLFDDEFCQISACIKFEIKKLEAHCHWIMHAEHDLAEEHLIRLKAIYLTLAQYYERLIQIDLSKNKIKPCAVPSSHKKVLSSVSKNTLLESFKVLQEVKREMIMANTRSDKISFMFRMSELCREFSVVLEEFLKCNESIEVNTECPVAPVFSSKKNDFLTQPHNEKLESLFRILEK